MQAGILVLLFCLLIHCLLCSYALISVGGWFWWCAFVLVFNVLFFCSMLSCFYFLIQVILVLLSMWNCKWNILCSWCSEDIEVLTSHWMRSGLQWLACKTWVKLKIRESAVLLDRLHHYGDHRNSCHVNHCWSTNREVEHDIKVKKVLVSDGYRILV